MQLVATEEYDGPIGALACTYLFVPNLPPELREASLRRQRRWCDRQIRQHDLTFEAEYIDIQGTPQGDHHEARRRLAKRLLTRPYLSAVLSTQPSSGELGQIWEAELD